MGCGASAVDNTHHQPDNNHHQPQIHITPAPQNQQGSYEQGYTEQHVYHYQQSQNQQIYHEHQHRQQQFNQNGYAPPQNSSSAQPQSQMSNSPESLEEAVALSRAILDSETDEEMKTRLSRYGEFAPSYTIREIIEANGDRQQKGGVTLFRYHKKVVCAQALKDLVRPEIKKIEHDYLQEHPEEAETFEPHDFFWSTPILHMHDLGMKVPLIKRYIEKCIVADLAGSEKDYWADIKQDVQTIIGETENPYEIIFSEQFLQELKEIYQRFLKKFERMGGIVQSKNPESGDPNAAPFPLDFPYSGNPELLRAWIETWAKFDTEVGEKEWDPWYFKEKFEDIPKPEEVLIRKDLDSLPEFNHEIDGEAAWDVIEIDLLKNDVTTPEQDKIWEQRESRKDFDNPESMEKRRKRIEQYFLDKYEWPASKLDPYRGFCDRLQEGWNKFQELC